MDKHLESLSLCLGRGGGAENQQNTQVLFVLLGEDKCAIAGQLLNFLTLFLFSGQRDINQAIAISTMSARYNHS